MPILLIEDEPRILAFLRRGLEAQGYAVDWAADGGEERSVVRSGRLELDLTGRRARLGELVCDLTDREFHLLHLLVRHEGEIVSRERLLADVWGYHFDPGSNVVDVCVRRLRKKLGGDSIETVRHVGYRVAA